MAEKDPSPPHATVHWAGETLNLLPARALWWPVAETIFMAGKHLGNAANCRTLGQPKSGVTSRGNFARLSELIAPNRPERLVFLGDFLHAVVGLTPPVLKALHNWRERHRSVTLNLVRDSHDNRAGDPSPAAHTEVANEPWLLGPFACFHYPQNHATHLVPAGQLHTVCNLSGMANDTLSLPCFVSQASKSVLPAFGALTGGHALEPTAGR